jgi:DNA-binding CsgD family transcriptional regulator
VGTLDPAAVHFEEALAFCRQAGYRPELARACHDFAACLSYRKHPGDLRKAATLLDESLSISTQLGMGPLMERAVALQQRLTAQPEPKPNYPGGLTRREVEVLRLLAAGKSSAEIAADLVLSRRTIERHISNIYLKTSTHNRAEATAFSFTHRLMSPT